MNNKINLILGIVIILTPLSGFPRDFKTFIFLVAGFMIVIYSVKNIRLEHKKKGHHKERNKEVFVESKPSNASPEAFGKNEIENTPDTSSHIANNE